MSYTPIEGGLPQNLLDEFRNISLAFARLKEDLRREIDGIVVEVPEVVLPPFPAVEDSDAFKDLNREAQDLREVNAEIQRRLDEILADYIARINNLKLSIPTLEELDARMKAAVISGLEIIKLGYTQLDAEMTGVVEGLASKANLTDIDVAIAGVYGAEVSQFTQINAEFTATYAAINAIEGAAQFDTAVAYSLGDLVLYQGNLYLCILATTPPSPPPTNVTYWSLLGQEVLGALGDISALESDIVSKVTMTEINQAIADVFGAAVTQFTHITAEFDAVDTALSSKITMTELNLARADIYGSTVAQFTNIDARFTSVDGDVSSKIGMTELNTAIANVYGASVETFTNINARFTSTDNTIATRAAITYVDSVVADEASARASTFALLGAENVGGTAFILNQSTVQVTTGTSWASWETTLQASIDGRATITQWQEVRDDTDSVLAKAGLQLNVNNHITGWALNNNGASGDMVIQVDRFFIVTPPGGPGGPTQVFAADASGVYIDTAYIRDLTVDVLTAGTINVPIDLTGSITIPNTGYIRSGQTAWNVGTGWWMGHEGGVPKFSLGAPTGQRLTWSAATGLQITGAITLTNTIPYGSVTGGPPANADPTAVTISNASGGLAITGGGINLSTNTSAIRSGQTAYNTGTGWWLGRDNTNGPRFSIGNGTTQYMRWTGGGTPALETSRLVVNGSIISNSPLDVNAARIHTGGGRTAPFVIYDVNQGSGETILGVFYGPGHLTGHYHKRLAFQNQDVLVQVGILLPGNPGEPAPTTITYFEYRFNGGNWIIIQNLGTLTGFAGSTVAVTATYVARFTTPNTWNTLDLRVRSTGATVTSSVFFNNANQANPVNAATSGSTSTTPLSPIAWTVPPGTVIP